MIAKLTTWISLVLLLNSLSPSAYAQTSAELATTPSSIVLHEIFVSKQTNHLTPQGKSQALLYTPKDNSPFMDISIYAEWKDIVGINEIELIVVTPNGKQLGPNTFYVGPTTGTSVLGAEIDLLVDPPGVWTIEFWKGEQLLGSKSIEIVKDYKHLSTFGTGVPLTTPYFNLEPTLFDSHFQTVVEYELFIDESGQVTGIELITPSGHPALDADIIKSLKQFEFIPYEGLGSRTMLNELSIQYTPAAAEDP